MADGGWRKKLLAAHVAAKDFRTRLKTGSAEMADPLLKSVYIEMKMMDAGYTYTELCGMDYTEFMLRYSILKVLKRAD